MISSAEIPGREAHRLVGPSEEHFVSSHELSEIDKVAHQTPAGPEVITGVVGICSGPGHLGKQAHCLTQGSV